MLDPLFFADTIATGCIISCEYYMIRSSISAWKHIEDPTFGKCVKSFISWVSIGTIAGGWLLFSHFMLR